jgi:hypothetical protein
VAEALRDAPHQVGVVVRGVARERHETCPSPSARVTCSARQTNRILHGHPAARHARVTRGERRHAAVRRQHGIPRGTVSDGAAR